MIQVWKGVPGIRDLTKIQCGIREEFTGKGQTATREVGLAKI